jgi:hypothetical protein
MHPESSLQGRNDVVRSNALVRRLAVPVLLAGLAAAFWVHRIHVDRPEGHRNLLNTDLFVYFYPTAQFLHDELRSGNLPLWNPYQLAGQPFLALHVPGVLYPPNLALMGLLQPARALAAHAVLHLFLAGLFTWLFAGRLGLGPPARLAAAAGFMLSGTMLYGIYMIPFLSSQAWLPAILWAVHGLTSEARPRWALALAVFLALSFLGGHAQGFYYEVQLTGVFAAFGLAFLTPRGARVRVLGLGVLGGFVALGLVMPQLLPTLELTREAVRGLEGVPIDQASRPSVMRSVLPDGLFGQIPPIWAEIDRGPGWWSVTLPTLDLPLIACGPLARRQRAHWVFFLCGAVLTALLLIGDQGPVFAFYYELPLGNLFRGPARMSFVYAFLV